MERDNSDDKIKIAKNIINHINNQDLMNMEITSLDRILGYYFDQTNQDPKEEKEVIDFLFKYYDAKGNKACVLFRHIKNSPERLNIINRLYHQYGKKFDFNFINPSLFLSAFDIIKTNDKLKKILYFLLAFIPLLLIISISSYFQNDKAKKKLNKQLNDQIQANEKLQIELKTVQQKYENDKKINEQLDSEMNSRFSNLKEEMQSIKENFQKELINVKEKQQYDNELKKCKESFQNEHEIKMKIEDDLKKCNTSLEVENKDKMIIKDELETCNNDKLKFGI